MDILGNLGKLLFGTGRQYDRDTVNSQIDKANQLNQQANDYYAKNIEGADWNSLSDEDRAQRTAIMNSYNNARAQAKSGLDTLGKAYEQEEKDWRYKPFGNGIIGGIVNPMYQAGTAAVDLMGGTYKQNNRDPVSDIGAGVESLMNIIPGASGVKALTSAGKISRGALVRNALSGAASSVAGAYREGGQNTKLSDALGRIPMGAAMGAAMPIGFDKFGSLKNKLTGTDWRKYLPKSTMGKVALGGGALYGGSKLLPLFGGGGQNQYQDDEDEEGYY